MGETVVPKDHPTMIVWHKYCETDEFKNALRWATATKYDDGRPIDPLQQEQHAKRAMWQTFTASWERIADLESQLKERDAYIQLLASGNAERIAGLEAQLAEAKAEISRWSDKLVNSLRRETAFKQRLTAARKVLLEIDRELYILFP